MQMNKKNLSQKPNATAAPLQVAARRRGRPRKIEGDSKPDSREALLNAARQLMIEKNSIDISLAEVADITGHSPGLIVYHFQNKENLLVSLIKEDAKDSIKQLQGLKAMDLPVDKKMRMHISGIFNAYYRRPYAHRLLNELMENSSPDASRKATEELLRPIADFQRDLLDLGVRQGVFRPFDPVDFYFIVLGACDQLFARRTALAEIFGVTEISEAVRQRYCKSLIDMVMSCLMRPLPA